jgi:hypothetical protein
MRKRRVTPIGAAFVALVLLVLLFVVRGALHHPAHVVLPQDASSGDVSDASLDDSAVGRIAVRPDTVQSAIATLERPARYSRAITIERYYSGGSGVDRSSVSVDGAWMRVDTEQASGAQSHTISNGERTWVWYGGSELYYESAAAFTADEEQGIPTYEDILRLDKKRIAAADYRLLDTVDCIFLETAADDGGFEIDAAADTGGAVGRGERATVDGNESIAAVGNHTDARAAVAVGHTAAHHGGMEGAAIDGDAGAIRGGRTAPVPVLT